MDYRKERMLIIENKVVGGKVVLSIWACGRNEEMKLKGLEGWESRLGWENGVSQSTLYYFNVIYKAH